MHVCMFSPPADISRSKTEAEKKNKTTTTFCIIITVFKREKKVLYALSTNFKSRIIIVFSSSLWQSNTFSTKYKYNVWVTRVLLYTSICQPVFISVCLFFFICLLFKTISSLYIFYLSVLGSFSLYYGWKKTAEIAEKCSSCLIVRSAIS